MFFSRVGAEAQGYHRGHGLFPTFVLHLSDVREHVSPWAGLAPSITSSHDSVPNRQRSGEQRSLIRRFLYSGRKFPHKSLHYISLGSHGGLGQPPRIFTDGRNQAP